MPICLWCSYDLTGLPEHHACPECGLEYDPQATHIRLEDTRGAEGFILSVAMVAAAFYSIQVKSIKAFVLALIGSIALSWMIRRWRAIGRPDKLIIARDGVRHCRRDGIIRFIPWSEARRVFQEPVIGGLVIADRWRFPVLHIRSSRFGGPAKVRKAIRFMRAQREEFTK